LDGITDATTQMTDYRLFLTKAFGSEHGIARPSLEIESVSTTAGQHAGAQTI